jgi:pimeloyl-ACP methyl ester carboxylesterase
MKKLISAFFISLLLAGCARHQENTESSPASLYEIKEGFVDANGVLIYYVTFGNGEPLVILHGGPGASHDYFLPYLLPYGHGKDYEINRYTNEYMIAAWGEGYFPYLYRKNPDPNYDPVGNGIMAWDVYREMWGSDGEFIINGNLKSVEYANRLSSLTVPTLITVGDNDECDPSLSQDIQQKISGSTLVILPESGHMTFVDQPALFISAVDGFLH